MTSPAEAASVYLGAFVEELARSGVRHVCIAPGSRSTPLAMTIASHPSLRTWMHLDERSAAFFALGIARTTRRATALLCTSGTAAANFFPAVVEARRGGVPLVVLTADRPHELRDVGAAQTVDQIHLYGEHAKWFVDVAIPEATPTMLRYVRTLACRAVATAMTSPRGPVHLNFPLREPLVPVAVVEPSDLEPADALAWHGRADGEPWATVPRTTMSLDASALDGIATVMRAAQRPIIVCGAQPDDSPAESIASLATALGAPVLADPLSQLRWCGAARDVVVDAYDAFLRDGDVAASLAPDLILRIGAIPTSKVLLQLMERHADVPKLVVTRGDWPDPTGAASIVVRAVTSAVCDAIVARLAAHDIDRAWLERWRATDASARNALATYTSTLDEPFEGRAVAELVALLPDDATLVVSSSMPIRDVDAFARGDDRSIRVISNRGANGIDGVVSTALGAAAANRAEGRGPTALVIGDLAMYHDMNGLLAAKLHALDATILLLNNDGGGIFSFLPQAADPERFEQLFGTPHGLDFAPVAPLYGARFTRVANVRELRDALRAGLNGTGLHVVELCTERARNVALHRDAWRAVADAVRHASRSTPDAV